MRSSLCPVVRGGIAFVFLLLASISQAHGHTIVQNETSRNFSPQNNPTAQRGTLRNQSVSTTSSASTDPNLLIDGAEVFSSLKFLLGVTVLSLAPSILVMTTCFVRFVVVLGLLKQALGTNNLPPNQVVVSLCLFLTLLVMGPVWKKAYEEGIRPYAENSDQVAVTDAFEKTVQPIRTFMSGQIESVGNSDTVWMLLDYHNEVANHETSQTVESYDDVPLTVLLPAYLLSELKTAFVIGFQVYLPFLVIDMVVSSVLVSMGMVMLPPVMVSLPFKLLLFVLIDGWFLTVGMLLQSVGPFG